MGLVFYLASVIPLVLWIHRPHSLVQPHRSRPEKGWQSSQGFNCCLIGYSNWNILLRGHLKLASLFQKMLSHCSKSHAGRVPYTQSNFTIFLIILNFFPLLLGIYSSQTILYTFSTSDYINNFLSFLSTFPKILYISLTL